MMKNPIAETVIGIPVSSVEGSSKGYFLLPEPAASKHHMHPPATEPPTWKQSKNLSLLISYTHTRVLIMNCSSCCRYSRYSD